MKKILICFLFVGYIFGGFTWGQYRDPTIVSSDEFVNTNKPLQPMQGKTATSVSSPTVTNKNTIVKMGCADTDNEWTIKTDGVDCPKGSVVATSNDGKQQCCNPNPNKPATPPTDTSCPMVNGIKICPDCLKQGNCGLKIYDLLGIRQSVESEGQPSTSPDLFVQDIILSATFFIGTILTIVIIYSGFKFILAGASGKDPSDAKSGLTNGIIGLLIVICSYAIIRAVQYIAKGL